MTLFARFKNPIHLYQLRPYLHLSIHHSYYRCYLLCHHHPVSILLFLPIDDHGHNLVPENISVKTRTYISTNDHILNIAVHFAPTHYFHPSQTEPPSLLTITMAFLASTTFSNQVSVTNPCELFTKSTSRLLLRLVFTTQVQLSRLDLCITVQTSWS
jgi:hypothetical protein